MQFGQTACIYLQRCMDVFSFRNRNARRIYLKRSVLFWFKRRITYSKDSGAKRQRFSRDVPVNVTTIIFLDTNTDTSKKRGGGKKIEDKLITVRYFDGWKRARIRRIRVCVRYARPIRYISRSDPRWAREVGTMTSRADYITEYKAVLNYSGSRTSRVSSALFSVQIKGNVRHANNYVSSRARYASRFATLRHHSN